MNKYPAVIHTEDELNEVMTRPYPQSIDMMHHLPGDIIILGVGGKMGPSLAVTAKRAIQAAGVSKRIIGVSRFSDGKSKSYLEAEGIECIACDLLDPHEVEKLPDIENVIFMSGRKFGTTGDVPLTWAMNVIVPEYCARRYAKSRIVAFSTGCVYPLVEASTGGCTEDTTPAPIGEYSQSCLGRERVMEYYSQSRGTPVCLFRLNYAVDLRYGVLYDIASKIWHDRPVNRSVPVFNVIWQGDAVNQALLALELCQSPAAIINCTGPEILVTTEIAERFAQMVKKPVTYTGDAGSSAFLNNAAKALQRYGPPKVSIETLLSWTAHWITAGGRSLNKPTLFEVRDGIY